MLHLGIPPKCYLVSTESIRHFAKRGMDLGNVCQWIDVKKREPLDPSTMASGHAAVRISGFRDMG